MKTKHEMFVESIRPFHGRELDHEATILLRALLLTGIVDGFVNVTESGFHIVPYNEQPGFSFELE